LLNEKNVDKLQMSHLDNGEEETDTQRSREASLKSYKQIRDRGRIPSYSHSGSLAILVYLDTGFSQRLTCPVSMFPRLHRGTLPAPSCVSKTDPKSDN
jgi:hypothetical protein